MFVKKYQLKIEKNAQACLIFSHNLELHGHFETGLKLLSKVEIESSELYKAKGNCYRSLREWDRAEEFYSNALELAENDNLEAYIYNNLAMLVRESKNRSKYNQAIAFCKNAILLKPKGFDYPKQNIGFFLIELSGLEDLELVINELKKEYGLGKKSLMKIFHEVSDQGKREKWSELNKKS